MFQLLYETHHYVWETVTLTKPLMFVLIRSPVKIDTHEDEVRSLHVALLLINSPIFRDVYAATRNSGVITVTVSTPQSPVPRFCESVLYGPQVLGRQCLPSDQSVTRLSDSVQESPIPPRSFKHLDNNGGTAGVAVSGVLRRVGVFT